MDWRDPTDDDKGVRSRRDIKPTFSETSQRSEKDTRAGAPGFLRTVLTAVVFSVLASIIVQLTFSFAISSQATAGIRADLTLANLNLAKAQEDVKALTNSVTDLRSELRSQSERIAKLESLRDQPTYEQLQPRPQSRPSGSTRSGSKQ